MWRWLALIWAVVSVGTVLWFVRLGRLRIKYAFPTMALDAWILWRTARQCLGGGGVGLVDVPRWALPREFVDLAPAPVPTEDHVLETVVD